MFFRAICKAAVAGSVLGALVACGGADQDLLDEHLRQGDQALVDGRYAHALSAYGHAHELAPSSPRVQRAQMWAQVVVLVDDPSRIAPDRLDDIAYEAELVRKLSPGDKAREAMCLAAIATALARKGDLEGAKTKMDEAVSIAPASAIVRAAQGFVLSAQPNGADAARRAFERALEIDPSSVRALVGLGQQKLAAGDFAVAVERFEAALRKREDVAARMGLGNARLQQGRHAEAAEAFQRVVALDPTSADARSWLGQALLGAGKLEEAERSLREAMSMRRDESTAVALGYALAQRKKPDEALSVFGQVLLQNPDAPPALYGAGVASEDLGRKDQALEFYRRLLSIAPKGPQAALITELQREARGRTATLAPPEASAAPSEAEAQKKTSPEP